MHYIAYIVHLDLVLATNILYGAGGQYEHCTRYHEVDARVKSGGPRQAHRDELQYIYGAWCYCYAYVGAQRDIRSDQPGQNEQPVIST